MSDWIFIVYIIGFVIAFVVVCRATYTDPDAELFDCAVMGLVIAAFWPGALGLVVYILLRALVTGIGCLVTIGVRR